MYYTGGLFQPNSDLDATFLVTFSTFSPPFLPITKQNQFLMSFISPRLQAKGGAVAQPVFHALRPGAAEDHGVWGRHPDGHELMGEAVLAQRLGECGDGAQGHFRRFVL